MFEFDIENKRIANLEQQCVIELDSEIFGLAYVEKNDCLLIATNVGLMGWNNSQKYYAFIITFNFVTFLVS